MAAIRRRLIRFRAVLIDSDPEIWRLLELDEALPLDAVHRVLQVAFGWRDSHLHAFDTADARRPLRVVGGRSRRYVSEEMLEDGDDAADVDYLDERSATLGEVLTERSSPIFYEYDFGDGWYHRLEYIETIEAEAGEPRATLVRAEGAPALDDTGGPFGWSEARRALTRPGSPQHQEATELFALLAPWRDPLADSVDVAVLQPELDALFEDRPPSGSVLVDEIRAEMADGVLPEFAAHLAAAGLDRPLELERDAAAAMVRPFRWLLRRADAMGGIPLTKAGWLPPAVVFDAMHELGWAKDWIGTMNREEWTFPIRELREAAVQMGVLRKYRGRLLATRDAGRLLDDPLGLLRVLARRALPKGDEPARLAQTFLLIDTAAGTPLPFVGRSVAFGLWACGWVQDNGLPVEGHVATDLTRPLLHRLDLLSVFDGGAVTTGGRWFAREVLRSAG